jgi:peptide/nickel transport system ATP-binding protein
MDSSPILDIQDLTIAYQQNSASLEAVRHASLSLAAGETCGLVGESGSGKTTLALAVMHFLPEDGRVVSGKIRFNGQDLVAMSRKEMRAIWGSRISMVPQETQAAFNPAIRLGEQAAEILKHHLGLKGREAKNRVLGLFERVRLGDPERVAASYPHQLSGGMLQRVATAMAISTEPDLLVLDEPTSSLDVTTQAAMLDLYRDLIRDFDTAVLYISHNLGVVAQITNRVVVMYAGELVEDAPTSALYAQPLHPYTRGLMDCIPKLGQTKADVRLRPIQDRIPPLDDLPKGCVFRPRCPLAIEVCEEYPPLYEAGEGRHARCHRWEAIQKDQISAQQPSPDVPDPDRDESDRQAILTLEEVSVVFKEDASLLKTLQGQGPAAVRAVNGVTFSVPAGRTMGLVGESGSGKTTLARAVVGLDPYTAGEILLHDLELPPELNKRTANMVCCLQIIFQDPDEALNPYLSVGEALRRPVVRLREEKQESVDEIVADLLRAVNLSADYAQRLPGQLSGGEKQRIALARAFAPNPDLLIADEPVSSLDVSVQASILNLFDTLQTENEIGTLFISHDLAVVGYLADLVAVIYLGQIMEIAPIDDLYQPPHHPYTEALLSSVPLVDPDIEQREIRLEGDVPSPSEDISGCPFHTRCPRFLGDICVEETPPWQDMTGSEKRYFCHIPPDELDEKQGRGVRLPEKQEE